MLLREGSGVCLFLMTVSQQAERWMELLFSETANPSPIPMDSIIGDDIVSSVRGTVQHIVQLAADPDAQEALMSMDGRRVQNAMTGQAFWITSSNT